MKKVVIILLILTACYSPAGKYEVENSRVLSSSKNVVWSKALAYFEKNKIGITSLDKDSGVITAETSVISGKMADCGRFGSYQADDEIEGVAKINVFVKPKTSSITEVTVNTAFDNIFYDDQLLYGRKKVSCESKGFIEKSILDSF